MATELAPSEGLQYAAVNAMSGRTVYWFLVYGQTCGAGTITSSSTLAALQEENGTSYARQAVTLGTAVNGVMAVPTTTFTPGANTNWHSTVALAGISSSLSGGVAIYVWDLIGGAYDMSKANSNLAIPSGNYFLQNPGGI